MNKTIISISMIIYISYILGGCNIHRAELLAPKDFTAPSGSETETSVTVFWDPPVQYDGELLYKVYCEDSLVGSTDRTFYTISDLNPDIIYSFLVKAKDNKGNISPASNKIFISTKKKGEVFNILDYGAIGNGLVKNTEAIQKAIDACTLGGTVYIPSGIFLCGALFLKSNMTLYIEKDGILKGSNDPADYCPFILNRYSGWEMETYASLINAGQINHDNSYNVSNISIRGEGTIFGGGAELGNAMLKAEGYFSRGRLICLLNCKNVNIQGLIIENSPSWTIHYIYCKNVSLHDLTIISEGIKNGDGIDPDSSEDSYIFNCKITTSDDCIAIKSGKNPEGNKIGKPTKNMVVAHCRFKGHGMSIGTEMSGGVSNILIRDCTIDKGDLNGLQIKVPRERGGYVSDVRVENCALSQIKIITKTSYNIGYEPAPEIPIIRDIEFVNLDMSNAITGKPAIVIDGFEGYNKNIMNIRFKDIFVFDSTLVSLNNCSGISFDNVVSAKGEKPVFQGNEAENINCIFN